MRLGLSEHLWLDDIFQCSNKKTGRGLLLLNTIIHNIQYMRQYIEVSRSLGCRIAAF